MSSVKFKQLSSFSIETPESEKTIEIISQLTYAYGLFLAERYLDLKIFMMAYFTQKHITILEKHKDYFSDSFAQSLPINYTEKSN